MVTEGMLHDIIQGDVNSLAVIMGHKLAHLTRDQVSSRQGETAVLMLAFGRDQEIDADLEGLCYAIAAGYPYRLGVAKVIHAMRNLELKARPREALAEREGPALMRLVTSVTVGKEPVTLARGPLLRLRPHARYAAAAHRPG